MEELSKHKESRIIKQEKITPQRIIGTIFTLMLVVLIIRFLFKLLGANPDNGFVRGIYVATESFVGLFEGIFSSVPMNGAETTAIFEPATLIAIVVIALVSWVLQRLLTPRIIDTSSEKIEHTEHSH